MESTAKKVDPVVAALNVEAQRHAAEEAHQKSKEAPPPPSEPAAGAPPFGDAAQTAALLVMIVDLAMVNLVAKSLAISPAERAMLSEAARPVVELYLPKELMLGPVGGLLMVAATIYAPKVLAFMAEPPPPASESTVEGTATEVKS